jgi:cbb3-type cytochrome oxidase maturation protein
LNDSQKRDDESMSSMLFGLSIGTWMLIIIMISFSGSALLIWYAAKSSGQFDDVEGIKYRMLEEDSALDVKIDSGR